MLFALIHIDGPRSQRPELCLIPDKPDQFSGPVRIEALTTTECALIRLSPVEMIRVTVSGEDSSTVVEPVSPAKLFLVPSQPDRPGFEVKKVKVFRVGDAQYQTFYLQDSRENAQWKEWQPNNLATV